MFGDFAQKSLECSHAVRRYFGSRQNGVRQTMPAIKKRPAAAPAKSQAAPGAAVASREHSLSQTMTGSEREAKRARKEDLDQDDNCVIVLTSSPSTGVLRPGMLPPLAHEKILTVCTAPFV